MAATSLASGRPTRGSSVMTREIARRLGEIGSTDIGAALARIVEDQRVPVAVRLDAARRMFGVFAGRVAYPNIMTMERTAE